MENVENLNMAQAYSTEIGTAATTTLHNCSISLTTGMWWALQPLKNTTGTVTRHGRVKFNVEVGSEEKFEHY